MVNVNRTGWEKLRFDENLNPYYEKVINAQGDTVKIQPSECTLPMLKELTVNVILKRDFYSPTGEPRQWFGVQILKIVVPNERQFRFHYLCYDKKCMSNICVKLVYPDLRDSIGNYNSVAWDFALSLKQLSPEDYEFSWIQKVGEPVTISREKAKIMLESKEAIALLNDSGQELSPIQ
jgi:hypothetical protein